MASQNWLEHTLNRKPWRTQRQAFALAALSFIVALIIGGLFLAQSATLSTTGRQLEELIDDRNQIEQANEQLRAEIARLQSVPRLLERARDLGFVEAGRENIEYIIVPGYNPQSPPSSPALEIQPTPQPVAPIYDETLLGWLQQQLDAFQRQNTPSEASGE